MSAPSKLLGPNGKPIHASMFAKEAPPKTGPAYGQWSGEPYRNFIAKMPGASVTQFDLSLLTLDDFRNMRSHPSVNTALSVLSFMQHQSPWKIVHSNKKVVDECTRQLEDIWTQLNRGMAQANWAGYSPCVLEWENDVDNKSIVLHKIKDLIPDNCLVNWKEEEGYAPPGRIPPKFQTFDGIQQLGQPGPIPVENSLWYVLLMENGNYNGRRLLEAAFTPWYFSMLLHIYANRYYERFGEPTAVGRAPFDEAAPGGGKKAGNEYMLEVLENLRSRGVVVLSNDGRQDGTSGKFIYDYDINFLESQMRGADFERYMLRLDEEISLALFTPTLLFRVADVGSYNLGQGHMQVYLWMMNMMNSDRAEYINRYILDPIMSYNFSAKGDRPKIVFKKLGDTNALMYQHMITAMLNQGTVKPDLEALGEQIGMSLKEVKQTLAPPPQPSGSSAASADGAAGTGANTTDGGAANSTTASTSVPAKGKTTSKAGKDRDGVIVAMMDRVIPQVIKYKSTGLWKDLDFGFKNTLASALRGAGVFSPEMAAQDIITEMHEFVGYLPWDDLTLEDSLGMIQAKLKALVYDSE